MYDNRTCTISPDVRHRALPGEKTADFFIALFLDNFDLVVEILFNPRHVLFFNSPGTFVLLSATTREHPYTHNNAFYPRRHDERGIPYIPSLLAEDSLEQLLFRTQLRFTFGGDFPYEDISRANLGTNTNDATFIQVSQRLLTHIRDVPSNFFLTLLGIAGFNLKFLNMDRGKALLFDNPLTNHDGIFEVIPSPRHEGHQDIAS